ncbi:hypothetical protein [Paenibacillus sp. RC84]|uniref:hypothetical protein n=1 Tax=Paenibacillus sp. RC84 TaxID=3156252 RepID=UPI003511D70D
MAVNASQLARDKDALPVPQYYNPAAGQFEPLHGSGGATYTQIKGSDSLESGLLNVSTPGTRIKFPNVPCREVMIIARRGNTGFIYIGGADVSSSKFGAELGPLDSVNIAVSNASLLYLDASIAGEGVSYVIV